MALIDHFNLFQKYRVADKNDDDIFHIKYVLADEFKPSSKANDEETKQKSSSKEYVQKQKKEPLQHEKKSFPIKNKPHWKASEDVKEVKPSKPKPHKRFPKRQWIEKKQVAQEKKQEGKLKKIEKEDHLDEQIKNIEQKMKADKIQKSRENYEMFEKLAEEEDEEEDETMDNLMPIQLKSQRSKSSEFKEIFPEMELARKSQLFIKDPRKLYNEYIDLKVIEKSRENDEGIYYKGVAQFSDTIKWYCNIISNELEGVLVAEGRNTNRALHEDEVYFKVISYGKEKILCSVVAIIKRRVNEIVGKIELNKSKQIYLLKPTNAKFASMNINLVDINKEWLQNVYTKYFLAKFSNWDATEDHPYCKIIEQYGNFGQVQIETLALLKNYGIENKEYSQKEIEEFLQPFKNNIDQNGEYVVPQEQLKKRKDFRKWRTFIVKNCQFDAAFSVSPLNVRGKTDPNFLKKNIFEVNVHFIDVAYFVRQKSALDEQTKKKLASYNLVYKILSLLPNQISDKFCNLRQNKDILTISVGFHIDEEGNILDTSKIAKSIISPPFIFSNDQLQKIITTQVPFEQWKSWNCGCKMESEYKSISADIKLINKLISKRRENRIQNGALIFEIPIKSFQFDENLTPTHFELKVKNEANYMIEECVMSASAKVGEYLFKNLKSKAILYRHRFPGLKKLNKFQNSLKKMGQSLPEGSVEIQKFINEIITNGQIKQCIKDTIKYQAIKLLQNFDYFQVLNTDPSAWIHYAINIPIYTHCSTPKKFYGDLLVQRQLSSILQNQPLKLEGQEMNDLLDSVNKGKLTSQQIRIGCEKIFLCLYLRNNPVFTNAVLTDVEEWGLKICIPKFNFKTMIKFKHLKSIKVTKFSTDESSRKYVKIDFTSVDEDFKTKLVLKQMQEINIQIGSANSYPLDYAFNIVLPHPTAPELKILIS